MARLGGDEFAIVIDHVRDPSDAVMIADRVIHRLSESMRIAGKELYTSASIGIAFSHERYQHPEELLRDADVAMYRAKAAGRQRFALFDEGLHEDALRQLDLEGDLRRAMHRGEFEPYYQPIVRLSDGAVVGYEALIRWLNPERGCVEPGSFLTTIEETGMLPQIDWQIYDHVCCDIRALGELGNYVTINVSPRHLRAHGFSERLLALMASHEVGPGQLRMEVTEGALLENPEQVQICLAQLRAAGVQTLLDDFGTGFSSLSYLHRFPLHGLKIDRSFVAALQSGESGGTTRDRQGDSTPGRFAGPGSGGRRRRDRGAAAAVAPARPHPGPGLSVRQAGLAGGCHGTPVDREAPLSAGALRKAFFPRASRQWCRPTADPARSVGSPGRPWPCPNPPPGRGR